MNGQKKAENELEYELFHLEMAQIIFEQGALLLSFT